VKQLVDNIKDGVEAISQVKQAAPDLVILDDINKAQEVLGL
jgi:CheY-like chemotaxis protein